MLELAGSVEITEIVHERMHVQIKCPKLQSSLLTYSIETMTHQSMRKGSFLGHEIQLNMHHMPDGDYFFNLSDVKGIQFSIPFFKRALHPDNRL